MRGDPLYLRGHRRPGHQKNPSLQQWYGDETPFAKIWCLGRRPLDEAAFYSPVESKGGFKLSDALKNPLANALKLQRKPNPILWLWRQKNQWQWTGFILKVFDKLFLRLTSEAAAWLATFPLKFVNIQGVGAEPVMIYALSD